MTASLQDLTEETIAAIAKAQTSGLLESTGIYSYDLSGLVSLIPVVTPFRDTVARKASPNGNPFAVWRALMDVTNSQPDPSMGIDKAANEVLFSEQDFQAKYMPTGLAGLVTQDAVDYAKGMSDPYAVATFQTLNQVLIGDDRKLIGAQSVALPRPAQPVTTTSTTGGTIPTGSVVFIGVAARTGSGYYYGTGNSRGNVSNTITTGAGNLNTVSATVAAVKGAVAYDWFYSLNGTTNFIYAGTTTVNAFTLTAIPGGPVAIPALPDISTVTPTYNGAADNGSANVNDYDGFIASLTCDFDPSTGKLVQAGTGTSNGAVFQSADGAALTLSGGSVAQIDTLFMSIWNKVKTSPTALQVNAVEAAKITNLILANPGAVTFLAPDNEAQRTNAIGGGYVGSVINKAAGGVRVPIEVQVSQPPGTIIARTDRVPFPQSEISNVLEYRALRDTSQFDYATNRVAATVGGGPRKEFEIRSVGAFINRAPVSMGILSNVG